MIASLIGAGLALYGPAAAAQEQAENNKGSVAFSPLNVSAADSGKSSEKTHWPGRARSARAMKTRIWSRWTAFCAVCRAPIPRSIPGRIGQRQYSRPERLWPGQHHGRRHHAKLLRQLAERRSARGLPTSQFGALIDPNFIVGVDVARGNATGSAGVNALAGSANFRTIGVDDVVFSDNPFGVRTKFSVGNNGIGRSGMIAVGAKTAAFADGGSPGAMAAISGSSITSNYKNGAGFDSEMFNVDKTYRQNPKSQLFKVDIKPDAFNSIELSARSYQNKITRRHIDSDDFTLNITTRRSRN